MKRSRRRAGIIGPGGIGQIHATALRQLGIQLSGVAASSPERAAHWAKELVADIAFPTAQQLVESDEVDVVHICAPNHLHTELARLALSCGKHVICEKPLATATDEAVETARRAHASTQVATVCYHLRFVPALVRLRQLIQVGELGRVHMIHGAFLLDEILRLDDQAHWMLDPQRMGPSLTLADIGVHWWDLLCHLTGQQVVAVSAAANSVSTDFLEDSAGLMLRLSDGALAVAAVSQAAGGHENTFMIEVIGTESSAAWRLDRPDQLDLNGLRGDTAPSYAHREGSPSTETVGAAFRELIRAAYSAASGGPNAVPTFADGARGVAVLEAATESARSQAWIPVAALDLP